MSTGGSALQSVNAYRVVVHNPLYAINFGSSTSTDARDIGLYGLYGNAGSYNYAGFYRDATTKKWTAFTATAEPNFSSGSGTSALSGFTKVGLDVGASTFATLTVTGASSLASATLSGQLLAADGSAGAPSISFASETVSGWYRSASNTLNLSVNSATRLSVTAAAATLTVPLTLPNTGATSSAPAVSFAGSASTGLRYDASQLKFTVAATEAIAAATTFVAALVQLRATAAGSAAAPDIAFGSNSTGLFYSTNTINFSANSTNAAQIDAAGLTATQVSTPTLTSTGSITVGQPLALGSNGLTTTGTVTTGTLTSAAASISVTKPLNMNSNNITAVNSLSLSTLTGAATIAITQAVDFGANIVNASDIRGASNVVTFNNGAGYISAATIRNAATTKTASYSVTSSDHVVMFNVSSAATCTLPLASTVVGQKFVVVLTGSGSVIVACSGSDVFGGAGALTSITIARTKSAVTLTPDAGGTFWLTL